MKRRGFLVSSLAASALAGVTPSMEAAGDEPAPEASGIEYYELRRYLLRRGPQTQMIDAFFRDAAIPALNRQGLNPVGVFNVSIGPGNPAVYVLTAHPTIESAVTSHDRLAADPEFLKAGADFINATPAAPAYERVESTILAAFSGWPKLTVPGATAGNQTRIFELRTYQSHSKKANLAKVHMFNSAEMTIFRRTGLHPVFFGNTLVGDGMPCLTYMLVFQDMDERARAWAAFGADPEWKKLSSTPGNTDGEIVCNITNVILTPAAYSQI